MNASSVLVDTPQLFTLPSSPFKSALPSFFPLSDKAYIRFHGRNRQNWYNGNATTRYDYLYNDSELKDFTPIIKTITATDLHSKSDSTLVQIYFNNHAKGQAVINGQKMKLLLA
jgi:uncharacterized protein YecE (DUF72 family)